MFRVAPLMFAFVSQFRMTEFGTLEIVTDLDVKGQQAEPKSETLDPAQSHTPTPPPEGQSQTSTKAAQTNPSQSASSQAKGRYTVFKLCDIFTEDKCSFSHCV